MDDQNSYANCTPSAAVVAACNGKIYVIGGRNSGSFLGTVEEYDPITDTWTSRTNMPTTRFVFGAAAATNGKIYAVGGEKERIQQLTANEEYTPPLFDLDSDGDGILDSSDNCPATPNADQADNDADREGDACDTDDDNDTVADPIDNCPFNANLDQTDSDHDTQGDVCDGDLDGDGVANGVDNCPSVANSAQSDFDGDGAGDICDANLDDDRVANLAPDLCAFTPLVLNHLSSVDSKRESFG